MKDFTLSRAKIKSKKRIKVILIMFLLFAFVLSANIFNLSILKYQYYKDKTYDQLTTTSPLYAKRGTIYDNNKNILASSTTNWRIFLSPKEIRAKSKKDKKDYTEIIGKGLSEILGIPKEELISKIKNSKQLDLTVKKNVSDKNFEEIMRFAKEGHIENLIHSEAQTKRTYPEGTFCSHVIGFTGSDNQGLYGLEYYYNDILSGKNGYYLYEKDANGFPMPNEYIDKVDAIQGQSIVTTIDSFIQRELENVIEKIRVNHLVQNRVTGVIMDTKTGAILGMATSSPFDPNSPFELDAVSQEKLKNANLIEGSNEYNKYKTELMQTMWSNKAISETYEPGSTFKIITVSSALDCGKATMHDTFSCHGYHMVGGWKIRCHKAKGHGSNFPLSYGLQMSCNPTMMVLAERVGVENFYNYVEKFGYFEKSGIDLPSEARTIFHQKANMGPTELATASFGQRFKVSVINHLRAISAVANGGYLVTPHLVDRILDENGNTVFVHNTEIKRRVISESVAREVADVLEKGVSGEGGAKNAFVDGYLVAAKTGTSQKFDVLDANGNSYLRIGSTVAFSPSNDSGISIILVVDEPQCAVKYGSVVAAPYVSEILSKVLPYLNYESSKKQSFETVGNYIGMNINSVKNLLKDKSFNFEIIGNGDTVISQMPQPNLEIHKAQSKIYIYTEEKESDYIRVPSFIGRTPEEAYKLITSLGLNILLQGVTDLSLDELTVYRQSISPGEYVKQGTVIKIYILGKPFED